MAELRQGANPPAVRIATFLGLFIRKLNYKLKFKNESDAWWQNTLSIINRSVPEKALILFQRQASWFSGEDSKLYTWVLESDGREFYHSNLKYLPFCYLVCFIDMAIPF